MKNPKTHTRRRTWFYPPLILALAAFIGPVQAYDSTNYPLDISDTAEFSRVWWDKKSGGRYDGAYYKPIAPSGYYILGHYGQGNYHSPRGRVIVVKAIANRRGSSTALKRPAGYTKIWGDHGSGAKEDGAFWRPIPYPGYKCLGTVATRGYRQPSRNEIRCVRYDLVVPAKVGGRIWIDKGTGAKTDFGSWYIVPSSSKGINSGLFVAHTSHRRPSNRGLYTLKAGQ
ncbi:MAG: hypothetical protein DRR08_30190 [Candidatus Parabeggiatoa sp. nov. 2]|nr:MAG: hypothetical protein DRR08_30190 [Gammaproteobacteria bacterium]